MALLSLYDSALLGRADAPAMAFEGADGGTQSLTFREVESRSNRLALLLSQRGIAAADRPAFFLPNRPEVIDLWLACVKLGAIVVPINVLYRDREIGHIVRDAEPAAVVTTADLAAHLPDGVDPWDVDELHREATALGDVPRAAYPTPHASASTPAALVYTSGTTGASKGAILTHGNFVANALALVQGWGFSSADRYLAALPLFHVHGLGNGVHCWLASGCHMMLVSRFDGGRAAEWFRDYRPTVFFGVPTMYVRLLELSAADAREIGASVRLFVSGSAPLSPATLHEFAARFGHTILERYGMTETLMNASNPYAGERRAGTVGVPMPMTELRIVDANGAEVPVGETGEVLVRGPNVCAGYWRRPDATASAFVDGWFRTGDIGWRSDDGYLTLAGRRSDLIISGGYNIYPREIEELLQEQPGVREAAVAGVPDPVRGEVPVAWIVADEGADTASLIAALQATLRASLASFKMPRRFVLAAALPRTALGKVQKHLLVASLAETGL